MILILAFHEVQDRDAAWAVPLLQGTGCASCEYSFVNIFIWAHVYHTSLARLQGQAGDWVIARSEGHHSLHYLYPAGQGDEQAAVQAILQDCRADGRRLVLFSVSPAAKARLEQGFPGVFRFEPTRDNFDYLYDARELAELPGKRFQKKRNHVSRFLRENPDWQFLPITPAVMPALLDFNDQWCHLYNNLSEEGIADERLAIQRAFAHYDALGLQGGYLTAGGQIMAYSFGSAINRQVFDVHVEKALYDVNGAYNVINREMARHYGQAYALINREDDLGEEGLRAAKLSYQPVALEEKYLATLAEA